MTRLYNEYEMLTEEGKTIDQMAADFTRGILAQCVEHGYSLRDAELVIVLAVTGAAVEATLLQSYLKRKGKSECPTTSAT